MADLGLGIHLQRSKEALVVDLGATHLQRSKEVLAVDLGLAKKVDLDPVNNLMVLERNKEALVVDLGPAIVHLPRNKEALAADLVLPQKLKVVVSEHQKEE